MPKIFLFLVILGFILLALIELFEFFPLFADYTSYSYQVGLQSIRTEVILNSAIELQQYPQLKSSSLSNLEVAIPLFEQEQNTLLQIQNSDDKTIVNQSIADFKAVDVAAKIIIANRQHVDPTQVAIIVLHAPNYRATINQLNILLVAHSQENVWIQFAIKSFLIACLCGVLIGKFVLYKKQMLV